jgi:hypothetical protein
MSRIRDGLSDSGRDLPDRTVTAAGTYGSRPFRVPGPVAQVFVTDVTAVDPDSGREVPDPDPAGPREVPSFRVRFSSNGR